ncbi:MAG: hypothetical protein M5U28_52835 [Sandaracinaceae bacterium]|nr:hypothetical protein [Sandaracinaceae bacterium]
MSRSTANAGRRSAAEGADELRALGDVERELGRQLVGVGEILTPLEAIDEERAQIGEARAPSGPGSSSSLNAW